MEDLEDEAADYEGRGLAILKSKKKCKQIGAGYFAC